MTELVLPEPVHDEGAWPINLSTRSSVWCFKSYRIGVSGTTGQTSRYPKRCEPWLHGRDCAEWKARRYIRHAEHVFRDLERVWHGVQVDDTPRNTINQRLHRRRLAGQSIELVRVPLSPLVHYFATEDLGDVVGSSDGAWLGAQAALDAFATALLLPRLENGAPSFSRLAHEDL
jgi:hypothetical protein